MRMHKLAIGVVVTTLLFGCSSPQRYTSEPMSKWDSQTEYRIDDTASGFSVTAYHERYQFLPDTAAIIETAKATAMSIAYATADSRQRKIKPINEQRMKLSTGRNIVSGTTGCNVQLVAEYE